MRSETAFRCSMCGECCRHIDLVPQLSMFDSGNGTCVHLQGNLCDIYDSRPEVCRVDAMYEKYFIEQYSREEFYRLNEEICQKIKLH